MSNVTADWKKKIILLLVLALLVAGLKYYGTRVLQGGEEADAIPAYVFDGFAMGGLLTIKIRTDRQELAERAADSALAEVHRLHRISIPRTRRASCAGSMPPEAAAGRRP